MIFIGQRLPKHFVLRVKKTQNFKKRGLLEDHEVIPKQKEIKGRE